MIAAAQQIAGGPNISIRHLTRALELLIDSGKLQPRVAVQTAELEEPAEDTRPRDKSGKLLTPEQMSWGEMSAVRGHSNSGSSTSTKERRRKVSRVYRDQSSPRNGRDTRGGFSCSCGHTDNQGARQSGVGGIRSEVRPRTDRKFKTEGRLRESRRRPNHLARFPRLTIASFCRESFVKGNEHEHDTKLSSRSTARLSQTQSRPPRSHQERARGCDEAANGLTSA